MRIRLAPLWLVALPLALTASADAHPLNREAFSLRSGFKMGPSGLMAVVILEKPTQHVLGDLQAAPDPWTGKRAGEEEEDSAPARVPGTDEQNAYARAQFQGLAAGLHLEIDGAPVEASFRPRGSQSNGKAGAGFFVYLVEVTVPRQPGWGDRVEVVLSNDSFPIEPMYYSGLVQVEGHWRILADSAAERLGADRGSGAPDDPRSWTRDPALRTLRAVFEVTP